MVDLPAQHRRQGGPATRQARLGAVAAAGDPPDAARLSRRPGHRAAPQAIEKLTSALAIFGEFICNHDPELRSVAGLERHHIEAFLAWTSTRASRGSHDRTRTVGPHVHAHAAITVRGFLDDITAWAWADAPRQRLLFDTDIPRQPDTLPRARTNCEHCERRFRHPLPECRARQTGARARQPAMGDSPSGNG